MAIYEDNNGGDVIEVLDHGNDTFTFQVGHCCVLILRKAGTISEITSWLTNLVAKLPEGTETLEH